MRHPVSRLLSLAVLLAACSPDAEFSGRLFADPGSVDLGFVDPERGELEPITRSTTITNIGSSPLQLGEPEIVGDTADWFTWQAEIPEILAPGDVFELAVTLQVPPQVEYGEYQASLIFEGDGVDVAVGCNTRGGDGASLEVPLRFITGNVCDRDGDGFFAIECGGEDCDDDDPTVYPGAPEICDGKDNNCDGVIDDGANVDNDGDGFSACDGDCDDTDPLIYPGAEERCNFLDDSCDGIIDEGFRQGNKYVLEEHCGVCDNDCTQLEFANATTFCEIEPRVPFCDFECLPGFFDANGVPDDGCECEFISEDDVPFDGIDANCDGADGNPDEVVFVSITTGRRAGRGTIDDPVDLISVGLDIAQRDTKFFVAVAGGTYNEQVDLVNGVTIFGGWNTAFDERDPESFVARIVGPGSVPAVRAIGIDERTVFDGLSIQGTTTSGAGAPAVGMWVEESNSRLFITNNVIESGIGRNGFGGANGIAGSDGVNGEAGSDGGLTSCEDLPTGGRGAVSTCGSTDVSGGDGGGATCPSARDFQPSGDEGFSERGGEGGDGSCDAALQFDERLVCVCRISGCWDDGLAGARGDAGPDGGGGSGGLEPAGVFGSGGSWFSSNGAAGAVGSFGGGGGGGGSGSGAENVSCGGRSHLGGTGGGGGSGGCGGSQGTGGGGGGSSLGVVLFYGEQTGDLPVFRNNVIASANGGAGGTGGAGGVGGDGGLGGLGGRNAAGSAWCGQKGGGGGDGGRGGNGGGGGGGAGGSSFAVFASGVVPAEGYVSIENELSNGEPGAAGVGGAGGRTEDSVGQDGVPGQAGPQNW